MLYARRLKLFGFFGWALLWVSASVGFALSPTVQAQSVGPKTGAAYSTFFTEEVLTVTRERDGILPGTLRAALIQASGISSNNSFTLVRIVFDPQVRRVQITKGPLPPLDGSLMTLDCQNSWGRVLLEWATEAEAGDDPNAEKAGLVITGNGNTIKGCHLTGFPGAGLLIRGNRNTLYGNVIGYHPEVPETTVPDSSLYEVPKTNGGSGIYLGKGANENEIQHNDIVANTYHGILLAEGVGTANKISYNFFAKNSGQPIKALPGGNNTPSPAIHRITLAGDTYVIEGTTSPRSNIQIYMLGSEKDEIGMLVAEAQQGGDDKFTIGTKSKGFVLNQTQLIALSHGLNQNTSEFSSPSLIGSPQVKTPSVSEVSDPVPEATPSETETTDEDNPTPSDGEDLPPPDEKDDPETVININGQGDDGSAPEEGPADPRQNEVSSLGN